jgi:hypothetical protein
LIAQTLIAKASIAKALTAQALTAQGLRRPAQPGCREKSDLSGRQFAKNRIMLTSIKTGFTFRFREWLRRSDKALKYFKWRIDIA